VSTGPVSRIARLKELKTLVHAVERGLDRV
jgi:hypothetical protein